MNSTSPRRHTRLTALALVVVLVAAACSSSTTDATGTNAPANPTTSSDGAASTTTDAAETESSTTAADTPRGPLPDLPAEWATHDSTTYTDENVWLCLPGGFDDVCDRNLDYTIVNADGTTEEKQHRAAEDPAVDCFYLYPTASRDETANSDFIPGEDGEISFALNQFARMTESCRAFAPVYRSRTVAALTNSVEDDPATEAFAYNDSLDAFRYYVANLSEGRPFVLMGHSQGAGILARIIEEEIDDEPALRARLVTAILLGTSIAPDRFENIGPCEDRADTGCLVTYSSYRSTAPPFDGALFGQADGRPALCTNPDKPGRRQGAIVEPYFSMDSAQPFADAARNAEITTPFVTYPDFIEVECINDRETGFGYLQLTVLADPNDPRTDDIGGDLTPEWGMHLVDVNVAMGDLVDLVGFQAATYADS